MKSSFYKEFVRGYIENGPAAIVNFVQVMEDKVGFIFGDVAYDIIEKTGGTPNDMLYPSFVLMASKVLPAITSMIV